MWMKTAAATLSCCLLGAIAPSPITAQQVVGETLLYNISYQYLKCGTPCKSPLPFNFQLQDLIFRVFSKKIIAYSRLACYLSGKGEAK